MKAYQCSKCKNLIDMDEYCYCRFVYDIRPGHRDKDAVKTCRENFEYLEENKQWHEKFYWE